MVARIRRIATLVFGLFFITSPWIMGFAFQTGWMITNIVLGIALAGLSAWQLSEKAPYWTGWIHAALGLYFLLTPFSFLVGITGGWRYVSIVLGAITLLLSVWDALASRRKAIHTVDSGHPMQKSA